MFLIIIRNINIEFHALELKATNKRSKKKYYFIYSNYFAKEYDLILINFLPYDFINSKLNELKLNLNFIKFRE